MRAEPKALCMGVDRRSIVLGIPGLFLPGIARASESDDKLSGYSEIDRGVANVLAFATNVFSLKGDWIPDFGFYDEEGPPNSEAREPIIYAGKALTRPQVIIGRKLVKVIVQRTKSAFGVALSGVFAHEFAHVFQMMSGDAPKLLKLDSSQSARLLEMHADFLAGWALPQAFWITNVHDIALAADEFYTLGDINFESASHHGSSIQRQSIMACGYTWGLSSPGDPKAASARGFEVIRDLFPSWVI